LKTCKCWRTGGRNWRLRRPISLLDHAREPWRCSTTTPFNCWYLRIRRYRAWWIYEASGSRWHRVEGNISPFSVWWNILEIMEEIPVGMTEVRLLLVQVRKPEPQAGLGPALHPGALSFYDKDKPSFLLAHADYVGLFLTVGLMAGSWLWELKRWMQRKQKNKADQYSNRVVALISSVQEVNSLPRLDEVWRELLKILTEAVHDLDADKLSEESFNSFRTILQIGMEVTKERRSILMSTSAATWTASAVP
jgi:hypothetical protein